MKTEVAIDGNRFLINGRPTYEGREYRGMRVEGLLFNSRMVQAIFDDECEQTRRLWAYPDTGVWNPDRNTDEFCKMLPVYRSYGLLAVTVGLQGGGSVYSPEVYNRYINSAFTPDGKFKQAYFDRLLRVLTAALSEYASWGFYHQGYGSMYKDRRMDWTVKPREREYAQLSGFQTVPVNWSINDEHKLAFFQKLKEITGGGA